MINSVVVYHSVTGNTKRIAEAIHKGMSLASQSGEKCDILKIQEVKTSDLAAYNLIGLGSPVYRQRELLNVTKFIENTLKNVDGRYGFAFCTHGAFPGKYLARVVPAMTQRSLTIVGWNDWFGSCYHPAVPKPYYTDGHPDEIDLKEAADFGREMVERSRRLCNGETEVVPIFPRGKEYDELYEPGPYPPRQVLDDFYHAQARLELKINPAKCKYPKCTFCMDKCPMHSIDLTVSPPILNINCDKCWLCEQACPNGAIELDWTDYFDAHLKMIPPLITSLEIFEKRGKFRRLVPLDKVGNKYVFQFKHPRFKVV